MRIKKTDSEVKGMDLTAQEKHPPSIMIVDDTPANLELLAEMLYIKGYRVVQFPNGATALAAAKKNPPDLILLDIMMPEMDGFEVCRLLKLEKNLEEVPVIFISALDDATNKVKAFSRGGVDYVTKPFQESEVYARVETHLKLHRALSELERHNHHLEDLVREKVREISEAQMATNLALAKLTECRDYETGKHIERVQSFCKILAEELQRQSKDEGIIDEAFIENIFLAAPLHDIGKVGIPDKVLLKPGSLSPEEFEIMKRHVDIGVATLQSLKDNYPENPFIQMTIDITKYHHEKWNGAGYPCGIAGESIPLSARIMAVADVYDALRSARPYKESLSHQKSCEIILSERGRHFDPKVIDAFSTVKDAFEQIFDASDALFRS
ncbi:MAG TPA: response regulator [Thermotogota bacterium]|nr:response regulator [Thermotogota bacterium]